MDLGTANTTRKDEEMTVITIEQAGKYDGQEVTLKGWLYNLRESGKLLFPIFRDGSGIIQGVCALKENPEAFESLKGLTQESSVIVSGKIRAEKRAPGGYEIGVTKIQIVQKVSRARLFRSSSRSTASIFCSINAISGFERPAKRLSCAFVPRPSAPPANSWTARVTR
jgi:asparaginyl-tRNA synthetase